jgi:hypothetical protein
MHVLKIRCDGGDGVSTFLSMFVGPTQQDNIIFLSSPDASHPYPSMTADQAS